jgi:hypothetical protein
MRMLKDIPAPADTPHTAYHAGIDAHLRRKALKTEVAEVVDHPRHAG